MTNYVTPKSKMWSQIKALGNPTGLKWTSPAATMFERIQEHQLQQELNMFMDFEFRPERLPAV